jgi:hypothetical protein
MSSLSEDVETTQLRRRLHLATERQKEIAAAEERQKSMVAESSQGTGFLLEGPSACSATSPQSQQISGKAAIGVKRF